MNVQTVRIQVVAVVGSLLLLFWVIRLIRNGKLKERYSALWFVAAAAVIVFAVWRPLLDILSRFFGIDYAPSLLFLGFFMLGVLLFMHFSVVISAHTEKITRLAQEVTFLKLELAERKKKDEEAAGGDAEPDGPPTRG